MARAASLEFVDGGQRLMRLLVDEDRHVTVMQHIVADAALDRSTQPPLTPRPHHYQVSHHLTTPADDCLTWLVAR